MSICWPVLHNTVSNSPLCPRNPSATGAILMASGRVPKTRSSLLMVLAPGQHAVAVSKRQLRALSSPLLHPHLPFSAARLEPRVPSKQYLQVDPRARCKPDEGVEQEEVTVYKQTP